MSADDDDMVGYGKPPKHTRFQKGKSGNPSGRPKKAPLQQELFRKELSRRVTITEGGRSQRITKGELLARQVVTRAIKGESTALRMMLRLSELLDASSLRETEALVSDKDRRNADRNVLAALAAMIAPEEGRT
jgi:hypothetical protein